MWRICYISRAHVLLKIEKNSFVYVCDMKKCVYACLHVCKINMLGVHVCDVRRRPWSLTTLLTEAGFLT